MENHTYSSRIIEKDDQNDSKPHFKVETVHVSKKSSKRGRKPVKVDVKAKLERSRQSARECRARKKLRYQYLEELVSNRERAIFALREELDMYRQICRNIDQGKPYSTKTKTEQPISRQSKNLKKDYTLGHKDESYKS